ncbi:snoRNA-binding rRNA-processing protein utp10 [Malassezia cuniculi]|uniref:U3 small nucleolar RNA-associated protein 10 n=1 Tax=Malassezia cuniculi TaxID=948313 RepID=A0AAF0J6N8_9BASI|nr:snoRNA-binding rRNA-processing protein utp10 [Malassezia cuniculi]
MTSALAAQLAGIQSHNAARLASSAALTKRDSYLFPARVAAEQDYYAVHALGVSGWEQLVHHDDALRHWPHANLLFGDQSIRTDRTTLPESQNAEIDNAVSELLYLIGPVLLSRNAAKVLEWLVRRFRIHEFSTRALLSAFLPYHLTPQFARMLQLLPLEKVPEAKFLEPVKKTGAPLPSRVLIQAAGANADALRLIADVRVPRGMPKGRIHVPFWTATLVQYCLGSPRSKKRNDAETSLAILLPAIVSFVDIAGGEQNALVGAFMVLSAAGAAFSLSSASVRSMLTDTIPRARTPDAGRAAVACAFSLCASPQDAGDVFAGEPLISKAALDALLALDELVGQIERAAATHDIEPFLASLLAAAGARLENERAAALFGDLIDISPAVTERALAALLSPSASAEFGARVRTLAAARQRHPSIFDAAVRVASKQHGEKAVWATVGAVLESQATGAVPAGPAGDAAIWLGMQSNDSGAHQLALGELLAAVDSGKICASDSIVRDAIDNAILSGDSAVLSALYAKGTVILEAIAPAELVDALAVRVRHAETLGPKELKTHVSFLVGTALAADSSLGMRIWREILWPHLITVRSAPKLAAATEAALGTAAQADGELGQLAKAALQESNIEMAAAIAGVMAKHGLDEHVEFLLAQPSASRSGVLALLVLDALLSLDLDRWIPLAYTVVAHMYAHGLLGGADEVDLSRLVHERPTGQTANALGVRLMERIVGRAPQLDVSCLVDVQQRRTPEAQLVLYIYQTLHAPLTSRNVTDACLPVLFRRLGYAALAFLGGVWTGAPHEHRQKRELLGPLASGFTPCSHVAVRLVSIRHAAAMLKTAPKPLDVQTLLPAVLYALQDNEPAIRQGAAALLRAAAALYEGRGDIYAFERVYGDDSAPLQYVDGDTAAAYVSALAADADAFVNDAGYVRAAHLQALAGKGRKETLFRARILCFLMSHAVCWNSTLVRISILEALADVRSSEKLEVALPLVSAALDVSDSSPMWQAYVTHLCRLFDSSAAPLLDGDAWTLFTRALEQPEWQAPLVQVLQNSLYAALPAARRQDAYLALARILASGTARATPEASACLHSLAVPDSVRVAALRSLVDALHSDDEPASKRARGASRDDSIRNAAVVLITVLESMQGASLGASAALVGALFDVVRVAVELHGALIFNAEYMLQLAMQSLCAIFDTLETLPADVAQVVRADTIVGAIKVSSNTQSINHAILLLTRFARLDAELVLHNVMPIFTFVGSTVLQRDDRFTLSVIEQTLRSIVPAFVAALRPKVSGHDIRLALWLETRPLLRIFADASSHIPRHRRHVFFRLLVEVLGADTFLAPVCMLLVDRVMNRVVKSPDDAASLLSLPLGVLRAEPPAVRTAALAQIWGEIHRLSYGASSTFLESSVHTKREHADSHLIPARQALAQVLFVREALASLSPGDTDASLLEPLVWHALVEEGDAFVDVRAAAFRLLPFNSCLDIIEKLMAGKLDLAAAPPQSSTALQAAGIALFADRLERAVPAERAECSERMASICAALAELWRTADTGLAHAALATLHECVATSTKEEHNGLLPLVPTLLCDTAAADETVLSLLGLLATRLGVRALAHVAAYVPFCIHVATNNAEDTVLVAGSLEALAALFGTLPQFVQSYVENVLALLCGADVQALVQARTSNALRAARRRLQDVIVKRMPAGSVVDAVVGVWPTANTRPQLVSLLAVLQQTVREMDRDGVRAQYKRVYRFLLQALDLRRVSKLSAKDIDAVEERSIGAFVALALRLAETQFRPLFLRTYDWAIVDLVDEGDTDGIDARALVFYRVVLALLEHLRGMFTSYYAVVLDNALETLASLARGGKDALWSAVVRSVCVCAQMDEGTFWTAPRATRVTEPLLAQLDRAALDSDLSALLTDTILAVVAAVPDDTCLRSVNTSLLRRARGQVIGSRVLALDMCAALWNAQGVALLGYMPDTVAALSELLDDPDAHAAAAALRLRSAIEKALGEPLDSYLE